MLARVVCAEVTVEGRGGPGEQGCWAGGGVGGQSRKRGRHAEVGMLPEGSRQGGSPRETDANVIALLCGIQTIAFAETENRLQWLAEGGVSRSEVRTPGCETSQRWAGSRQPGD